MQVDRPSTDIVDALLTSEGGRIALMDALGDIFPHIDIVVLHQQPHLWNLVRRILIP